MKRILAKYLDRLNDSIQRSALLRAYPPSKIGSRLDLYRLSELGENIPTEFLETLIYNSKSSYNIRFQYDDLPKIREQVEDFNKSSEEISSNLLIQLEHLKEIERLHSIFAKKLNKEAELIFRETGLRSIWLGYPLVYVQNLQKPLKRILAPVFLWPVNIKVSQRKQNEITIQRDDDAGAPIYNKAFDYWCIKYLDINPEDPYKDALTEIEEKDLHLLLHDIFKGFHNEPLLDTSNGLIKIPTRESLEKNGSLCLINSAIIGLIKWENQAIMRDLQEMLDNDENGFPELAAAVLNGTYDEKEEIPEKNHVNETQKYFVCNTDRFQEQAIFDAREKPGVIIHGPPGTGKSETIVNIIADCLARGEKILVICQKRAAIDVVYDRLKKINLDSLSILVHDSNNDRKQIIQILTEQLDDLRIRNPIESGIEQKRISLAIEIESIESELDSYIKALVVPDEKIKKPYRDMKATYLLIRENRKGLPISIKLPLLTNDILDEELGKLEHKVRLLGKLFFESNPLKNPWMNRCQNFGFDRFFKDDVTIALENVSNKFKKIIDYPKDSNPFIKLPDNKIEFLKKFNEGFPIIQKILEKENFEFIRKWLFDDKLSSLKKLLVELESTFEKINKDIPTADSLKYLYKLSDNEFDNLYKLIDKAINSKGIFKNIFIHFINRDIRNIFLKLGADLSTFNLKTELDYLKNSLQWVNLRRILEKIESEGVFTLTNISETSYLIDYKTTNKILTQYTLLVETQELLSNNLWMDLIEKLNQKMIYEVFSLECKKRQQFNYIIEDIFEITEVMESLSQWIKLEVLEEYKSQVWAGNFSLSTIEEYLTYLNSLPSLIQYDTEKSYLPQKQLEILDILEKEFSTDSFIKYEISDSDGLSDLWWDYTYLNILYGRCKQIESSYPILLSFNGEEYQQHLKRLKRILNEKQSLESKVINERWEKRQQNQDFSHWRNVLVLTGKKSKRLRQIVDLGRDKGLFDLRPCWLTNPNTACQIFSLIPEDFDIVIFDEASQCPIEQAIPIVYRAKRMIVSGDEKQLPPTTFFKPNFAIDEDEQKEENLEDEMPSSELTKYNVQEITEVLLNVEDLLKASKNILRDKYLNSHYRSKHPALINFSNHAFYNGRLEVPIRGISWDYNSVPPIVYYNIRGIYKDNTNQDEAEEVLELIKKIWSSQQIPSIGVVTFNSQQRDLIEDRISAECERDSSFAQTYEIERNRQEGKHDIGFFVKNLESVQGDERDVMIFSTTFGYNEKNVFERHFGPINEEGGERRLNVAITRAKERMYIITSMPIDKISDIIAKNQNNPGAKLSGREYLHLFLNYAKSVYEGSKDNQKMYLDKARQLLNTTQPLTIGGIVDSEFELQVSKALKEMNLNVENQVGESGFKIDIALKHENPSCGYILGIECDGATYHGTLSARLRDIWRQSILEDRGWNIFRIWSKDWWNNPDLVLEKIKREVEVIYATERSRQDVKADPHLELMELHPEIPVVEIDKRHVEEPKGVEFSEVGANKIRVDNKNLKFQILKNKTKLINSQKNEVINLGNCKKCGSSLALEVGNLGGPFLSCSKCKSNLPVPLDFLNKIIDLEIKCPRHGVRLILKQSRRGYFMGCPLYPRCDYTKDIVIRNKYL